MLDYLRSLIAELLPTQPKPRKFRRRPLRDRREATERPAADRDPAAFGRRGPQQAHERKSRR